MILKSIRPLKKMALGVSLWALTQTVSAETIVVTDGDYNLYDPANTYEISGLLGPDLFTFGLGFTDPAQALAVIVTAPVDLIGQIDFSLTSQPDALGLIYGAGAIMPGESLEIIMGLFPAVNPSIPKPLWLTMVAYDVEVPIPLGEEILAPSVPIPAAVWLFGSGLLGLVGVARRKKA